MKDASMQHFQQPGLFLIKQEVARLLEQSLFQRNK